MSSTIPPSDLTPAAIVAREQQEGTHAWTGPQGSADGWQLVRDFWNTDTYSLINACNVFAAAAGRLG